MENILFRGKRIDNGQWIYGWVTEQYKKHKNGEVLTKIKSKKFGVGEHLVDTKTVGQYIGFDDCKDRKIFDGDIVKIFEDDRLYHVQRECDRLGGYIGDNGHTLCCIGVDMCRSFIDVYNPDSEFFEVEVVGNEYDNPEMLRWWEK